MSEINLTYTSDNGASFPLVAEKMYLKDASFHEYEYTPDESTADYKIIFDCKSKEIISVKASKYIFKFE